MTTYSFLPLSREAKLCGVLSCVLDKLGCAADEKQFQQRRLKVNTDSSTLVHILVCLCIITRMQDKT